MSQKSNQDAKNIGARFRSARSLVPNLNRKLFCERHGINRYTMQSWENGLHVSKGKNVEKFIEALAREGVYCSSEWLIDGTGEPARPLALVNGGLNHQIHDKNPEPETFERNNSIIDQLIELYKQEGELIIQHTLADDAMAPKFMAYDTVLGRLVGDEEKPDLHQKYCIIELSANRFIVRKVIYTKEGFLFLALDERLESFSLSLSSQIYEIIWHLLVQNHKK